MPAEEAGLAPESLAEVNSGELGSLEGWLRREGLIWMSDREVGE